MIEVKKKVKEGKKNEKTFNFNYGINIPNIN